MGRAFLGSTEGFRDLYPMVSQEGLPLRRVFLGTPGFDWPGFGAPAADVNGLEAARESVGDFWVACAAVAFRTVEMVLDASDGRRGPVGKPQRKQEALHCLHCGAREEERLFYRFSKGQRFFLFPFFLWAEPKHGVGAYPVETGQEVPLLLHRGVVSKGRRDEEEGHQG